MMNDPKLNQVDYDRLFDSLPIDRLAQRGLIGRPDWLAQMDSIEKHMLEKELVFKEQPETLPSAWHAKVNAHFIDYTGRKIGRLTVIGIRKDRKKHDADRGPGWVARCDCGLYCWVRSKTLRKGQKICCHVCDKYARVHSMSEADREKYFNFQPKAKLAVKPDAAGIKRFMTRYGKATAARALAAKLKGETE